MALYRDAQKVMQVLTSVCAIEKDTAASRGTPFIDSGLIIIFKAIGDALFP
jgi:hypothetical protein